jgi:hypothetical protein
MKHIKFLFFAASFLSVYSMGVDAATVISTESMARGVRKVIVQQDDGATVERFELCDKETNSWLPARLDSQSNRWVLSREGEDAKEAKRIYIRDLHFRWEREERRNGY